MDKIHIGLAASLLAAIISTDQGNAATASVELVGNLVLESVDPGGENIGFHDNFGSSIYGRGAGSGRTYYIDNLGSADENINAPMAINTIEVFNQSSQGSYGRVLTDIATWNKLDFRNDSIYDAILTFSFDGFVEILAQAFGVESASAAASLSIDSKISGNIFDIKYFSSGSDKLDFYHFSEDFSLFLKAGQSDTVTIATNSYTYAAVPISSSLSYLSLASIMLFMGQFKRWWLGRSFRLG